MALLDATENDEEVHMKRSACLVLSVILIYAVSVTNATAHFGMVIPSKQMIEPADDPNVEIKLMFAHPFENAGMNLEKPAKFDVVTGGKRKDLLKTLKPVTIMGSKSWETKYRIKRPGIYTFFMEPKPYWEPAEDCYIVHYTKVVLSAFGLETGWEKEIGLKTEIIPLTRPYGVYAGNVFQGIVKVDGKPVPFAEVEVEYYNGSGGKTYNALNDYMVTQVIRADANGVFTYAIPKPGWWGFAALNTDDTKIKGKDVEIGAVIWIKFYEMK
jgi:cobalt/nickel transport protein